MNTKFFHPNAKNARYITEFILAGLGAALIVGSTIRLVATGWSQDLHASTIDLTRLKTDPPSLLDRRLKKFDYDPPKPGTYVLPIQRRAVDAVVTGREHLPVRLSDLMRGRITVLSFEHRSCGNQGPCELETGALSELQRITRDFPELAEKLLMLTLRSAAPEHTSEGKRSVQKLQLGYGKGAEWLVLSAKDKSELQPVLHAFGQPEGTLPKPSDNRYRDLSRVILVDEEFNVRNSYLYGVMDPRIVATDALTLLMEK